MVNFLDGVLFKAAMPGTGDFAVVSPVQGFMTPFQADVVEGAEYHYRAENTELTQWEIGTGVYAAGVLTRAVVLYNHSGDTSKIDFTLPPNVGIVPLGADFAALVGDYVTDDELADVLAGYALVGHTHTASEVTDFAEATDDRVSQLLVAGANITLTYNDASNALTIAVTDGGASVFIGIDPPTGPALIAGNLWLESDTGILYIYYDDGSSPIWMQVGGGASAFATTSDTPPAGPMDGQLWWRSSDGVLLIYYDDGTTSQWVAAVPPGASDLTGAVRYDAAQALTAPQQAQARTNIGAISAADVPASVLRGYLSGLTLSTAGSSTTFGIAAGVATDSTNTVALTLSAAITKTAVGWSVGNGGGALDTGSLTANTWYHVHLIRNPTSGVTDVCFSLSATAPTLPAGFTQFRRIGSMRNDVSAYWLRYIQNGDEFLWVNNFVDAQTVSITDAIAHNQTLTVPRDVQVNALFHAAYNSLGTGNNGVLISSLDEADVACIGLAGARNASLWSSTTGSFLAGDFNKRTDTLARIRWRAYTAIPANDFSIYTYGWIDRRGRDD